MRIAGRQVSPLTPLFLFLPLALALELRHADPTWIFVCSGLAIIPLAGLMGEATEHLAERAGAGVGGLLNATFGNAAELIIAGLALRRGLVDVVKASLTGSIIGNILLVGGLSVLAGGLRHRKQTFNATAAGLGATLLALSAIGLVVPALFHHLAPPSTTDALTQKLSLWIAIVLFSAYVLSLVFSLRTHSHLFLGSGGKGHSEAHGPVWSVKRAVTVLVVATAGVALMSETLVGSVEHAAETLGMSQVFVGVILVAIIGNAAEHSTAVMMALKNKMDLAMNICIGSSMQVALLIAPLLVFLSYGFGQPMDLVFTTLEVVAVGLSVGVFALAALDGDSHWMEGVLLLAVYAVFGLAFFYMPT